MSNMLISCHKILLITFLLLFLILGSNCQWHNAVEFWSNMVCSITSSKVVNFHNILDINKDSSPISCRFDALIYRIAQKCEMTVVSRSYTSQNASRNMSFIDNNQVVRQATEWPSVRRTKSNDYYYNISGSRRVVLASTISSTSFIKNSRIQAGYKKIHGWNTWNIHVILARNIHSFNEISKSNSKFEWNRQDRFIVLIARHKTYEQSNESNLMIDDILKSLWYKRKVQNIFVSQVILINNTTQIDRIVRTYNPFAKVNNSAWGKIEFINVNTTVELPNLTHRRTKNLNGYELRIGTFEQREPYVNILENSKDILIEYPKLQDFNEIALNTIAKLMNFKVKYIHPKDNTSFGYQLSNGTYVGALGDVMYGRTDIYFVAFFIKKYGTNIRDIDFTTHVEFDRVCVVVPKAAKIPKWLRLYHFFPPSVWFCSMLSHLLSYLTWQFLQIYTSHRTQRRNFVVTFYPSFLLSAGCPQVMPSTNTERILLAGIFLASVTMVGLFNGILYKSFARDMYYEDIDFLQDLDDSGLPISIVSLGLSDLFGSKNDENPIPLMQNLRKKLHYAADGLKNAAYYRNDSGLVREHHFPIINEELIDKDGAHLLHLVKECPGTYYLSYLLPRNSILRERINVLLGRLNQAGLPKLWNIRSTESLVFQRQHLAKQTLGIQHKYKMDNFVAFKLSDMQTSFYMLLIGLSLSTIIFFHEKGWLKPLLSHIRPSFKSKR